MCVLAVVEGTETDSQDKVVQTYTQTRIDI